MTTVVKVGRIDVLYFLDQREKSVNSSIASWRRGGKGQSRWRTRGETGCRTLEDKSTPAFCNSTTTFFAPSLNFELMASLNICVLEGGCPLATSMPIVETKCQHLNTPCTNPMGSQLTLVFQHLSKVV